MLSKIEVEEGFGGGGGTGVGGYREMADKIKAIIGSQNELHAVVSKSKFKTEFMSESRSISRSH